MIRSLIYSITFHTVLVLITILSLPNILKTDWSSSNSFSRINPNQIKPNALLKLKNNWRDKKKGRLVSEQTPPAIKAKEKPDSTA